MPRSSHLVQTVGRRCCRTFVRRKSTDRPGPAALAVPRVATPDGLIYVARDRPSIGPLVRRCPLPPAHSKRGSSGSTQTPTKKATCEQVASGFSVEAAGIEPASRGTSMISSTRLACSLTGSYPCSLPFAPTGGVAGKLSVRFFSVGGLRIGSPCGSPRANAILI